MPRKRGHDKMHGAGTQPAPDDSDIKRRKRLREPRSKEEMRRVRDPDAIAWSPMKSK